MNVKPCPPLVLGLGKKTHWKNASPRNFLFIDNGQRRKKEVAKGFWWSNKNL